MIRNYQSSDAAALLALWNTAGVRMGYAPVSEVTFRQLLLEHPAFSEKYTFVLEQDGSLVGFVNGCIGDHIAQGDIRGYISCLILSEHADTDDNFNLLLSALESTFRRAGRTYSAVTFFNPIRLPWVIPGTDGHQHNNCPGIPTDLPLYRRMLSQGYRETSRETAVYRSLSDFEIPQCIEERAMRMATEGYTVDRYDPSRHEGLEKMVESLNNPMWSSEIPAAGRSGMDLLVGLCGNICAGFTGPVYPEDTGRGYFAGIAVAPQFEHHGLGKLLFYRLLQREKAVGAKYMSLFTGIDNPARFMYLEAGFQVVRTFSVMLKEL